MSVQGTILVLDGVSTNRIMLKVQLTAAWYHVVQGEKLSGLGPLVRRARPDLVLASQSLPDGTAADVKKLMLSDPSLRDVPVIAIAQQNDKAARLRALSDGLDDVLTYPFKDTLLLARVRSFLRSRADANELRVKDDPQSIGLAEAAAPFEASTPCAQIAILAQSVAKGALWCTALGQQTPHRLTHHSQTNPMGVLSDPAPDVIVFELCNNLTSLNMLADLRSRRATRHTVLIGILSEGKAQLAAEALDRGADAICMNGFCEQELALRVNALIARKAQNDQMRASLRKGLADSWIDPLTGLYNRRYAMSAMARIARQSRQSGHGFAIMLADLDHFKAVNDRFGHAAGDQVLIEAGRRIQHVLGKAGFVARIGGEEFLIGVPRISQRKAVQMAGAICDRICGHPYPLHDQRVPIPITTSIGLKVCEPPYLSDPESVEDLIRCADKALYVAKKAGRNQFYMKQSAA